MRGRAVLFAWALAAGAAGCAGGDPAGARAATEAFYAALKEKDGGRACERLSKSTLDALEEQEGKCAQALPNAGLELSGSQVAHVEVAVTEAAVRLAGGDYVFLDRSSGRWEISAAGCQPGEPKAPFDCTLED